jgi:hypothetical protein
MSIACAKEHHADCLGIAVLGDPFDWRTPTAPCDCECHKREPA